jgi:hypothetical protein
VPVQSITYLSTLTLSLSPVALWTLRAKDYVSKARGGLGRDSSVGIATRYRLDGPGIESRWGARFSAPVQTYPGAHPASYTLGTVPLSRG